MSLTQAQQALTQAQNQLATDQANLLKNNTTAVTNAQNALDALKLQLSTSSNSTADQLASARLGLQSAQLAYASKTAPATPSTIASDQASVVNAQQALSQAQIQAGASTLTAPADGVVTAVGVSAGVLAPGGDAILLEVGPMQVTASFAESAVSSIKVGQPTAVTITALGQTFPGTVSQITPTASTSGGTSSVVTFGVQITLTDAPASVLSGMSASIAVTTAQATNVIAVPSIALIGSSGNYSVRVIAADGSSQVVPVQVGLVTTSLAEIQSGITDGTTVSIGTVSARTSTTTTTGGGVAIPGIGGGGGGFGRGGGGGVVVP